jgi:hypothetical protein
LSEEYQSSGEGRRREREGSVDYQNQPNQAPPDQWQQGQAPPGQMPPGQWQQGQPQPPNQWQQGQMPPGQVQSGQWQQGQQPPNQWQPGQGQPNQWQQNQPQPGQMPPGNQQGWNPAMASVPPEQFAQAAHQAFQQMNPQEYYNHTQPNVGGTNPFGNLPQPQQSGLAQTLLNTLFGRGVNQQEVQQGAGLSTLNPSQMSPQELAALTQWMQQNHPQALGQAAAQYQSQPDILSSLMGNKGLMAMGALLGAGYLAHRYGG